MTTRQRALGLPLLALLLGAGLVPATAQEDAFPDGPPRRIRVLRRPVRPAAHLPPAIVRGYLPRNNGVPMYNEPPGLRGGGYYGR